MARGTDAAGSGRNSKDVEADEVVETVKATEAARAAEAAEDEDADEGAQAAKAEGDREAAKAGAERLRIERARATSNPPLAELKQDGQSFSGDVVVKGVRITMARNGKPFASGVLSDLSGEVFFKKFDTRELAEGAYTIVGDYSEYRGSYSVIIREIRPLPDVDPDSLVYQPYDRTALMHRFADFVNALPPREHGLAKVLIEGDGSRDGSLTGSIADRFVSERAAMDYHDGVPSGLLAHSLKTATIAAALAGFGTGPTESLPPVFNGLGLYGWEDTSIDVGLAVVGALLHDAGKVFEYDHGGLAPMGRVLSHRDLMVERTVMLRERVMAVEGMDEDAFQRLLSIFSQHHGEYEENLRTGEAALVHLADDVESQTTTLASAFKGDGVRHKVGTRYLS